MSKSKQHTCELLELHNQTPFNMDLDIQDNTLIVYDTFNSATEKRYRKSHPDSYHIDINVCPFCGKKLL